MHLDNLKARYEPPRKRWWHKKVPWKFVLMIVIGITSFRFGVTIGNSTPLRDQAGKVTSDWKYKLKTQVPYLVTHGAGGCVISGCGGYECVDPSTLGEDSQHCILGVKPELNSCMQYALCQRQPTGKCGWTETQAYYTCGHPPQEDRMIDLNQDVGEVFD